ncbi:hypothetical protein [Methylobacterium gregans]|uniref:Uncharacterized protein n=1 Tax=Methylobacterium gregans TaxID=374424 RepID=A0AA37MCG8_9HYPH|nr:hypothetical protein [Methylobacterium gregans]MDQ0523118.1 hypothetical protein [Methylobacterium gregans]GJD79756.1 hypothetical protein NBEOAGPD_2985 [Methylobacterium gregans]
MFETDDPRPSEPSRTSKFSNERSSVHSLPAAAQRTLDDVAEALGLATELLGRIDPGAPDRDIAAVSLAEASALLQAFIRIEDPATRQRCLAFVQAAAAQVQGRG